MQVSPVCECIIYVLQMIRLLSSILHHFQWDHKEKRHSEPSEDHQDLAGECLGLQFCFTLEKKTLICCVYFMAKMCYFPALDLNVSVPSPPPLTLPPHNPLLPPTVVPCTLKEGIIEKKGHSVAFLMWPE